MHLDTDRSDAFPADFLWGCASASYQVEGSTDADGRGESIWDRFCRTPGKVFGGATGDVACDSYKKMDEDISLLRGLGAGAYRFSIAWPRIFPQGSGGINEKGFDYYRRLADSLLEAGITPWATLYHWDLPQDLEDAGGWPVRDTAFRFAEYAEQCFRALGDRIAGWMTLNEPWCSSILGYMAGEHAPGRRDPQAAYRAAHHLLLAHGLATERYRGLGMKAPIGIVINPSTPRPATRRPEDIEAAERASDQRTALWLDPLNGRGYPERHLSALGVTVPVLPGDMERIAAPLDFLGINYYNEECVEADPSAAEGFARVPTWQEKTEMGWDVVPDGLYRVLRKIAERWAPKALYVTENGAAFPDLPGSVPDSIPDSVPDPVGKVHDPRRIAYLAAHLKACERAISEGIPLKGYFAWSLMDNFEWAHGYSKRFGLTYVDFSDGKRTPKDSYYYYRDAVAGAGL
ncbi:MAG: GH1 family beta-glucosidase [Rectinemataceae bacterium]